MRLQSLELLGFKSFADKTVFNFHEGFTAIVGPNGCGKSNVLDAVRWVLGEQSAKSLRGGEMADVIFNGTDARKPVGFAEVSLTFTDCAAELGVDWHEVRATRRVYRDGLSEYLLNKTVCRLKDIQSLFADTGIGRSAYSMMEQGRIDQILSSRPEDRRAVFEEAAGITKYKSQKREALRKLEATEANLLRLGDIIKEVKRQIGSLQRQAGKARRYQALLADLQVLDTHHSHRQLDALETELTQSRTETVRLDEQQRATERAIEERENEVAAQRGKLEEVDARISEARGEVQRLQNQIASHRNRIELNRERAQELSALIERYELDIKTAETKRAQQETEIHETDALLEETERLLATKQNELEQLTQRAAEVRREREEREHERQTLELTISKLENRVRDLEEEVSGIRTRRTATEPRLAELETSLGEATAARDRLESSLGAARATAEKQEQTVQELAADLRAAEEELGRRQQALRESEMASIASDRAIAEQQSRLEILQQSNDEGEGLAQGSQAVLKGLGDPERILPAVMGAFAALIEVDEDFIPAVEAALGRNLHAIVLQNGALATEIIAKLTEEKLGQTALISPELFAAAPQPTPSLPEGAIAWACEKVHAPAEFQPLVRRLLGEVLIVDDLEQAQRLKKELPFFAIATLSGELISAKGVVYGGRVSAENSSLFARKAQISSLSAQHRRLLEERQNLRGTEDEIKAEIDVTMRRLTKIRERHEALRVDHSASAMQISALERELHEANRKVDATEWEKATLAQQLAASAERIARLEDEAANQKVLLGEQRERRTTVESAVEAARLRDEQLTAQLSELRLAVATERQRHESLRGQRQPMAARQAELAELIASRRADIAAYRQRREQQAQETAAAESSIEANSAQLSAAESTVAEIAGARVARLAEVNALEGDLRARRKSLSDLHEARGKEEVRQTQIQLQIDNLAEHVARRYQVNLREFAPDRYAFTKTLNVQLKRREKIETEASATPAPDGGSQELAPPDVADVEAIIAQLTQQLDLMGPVNLDAVHEYDELEERHGFLETQNNDLTASRRELLDVIARINQTTQKLFADTFAQVRINFREMFAELFGGGRADLVLLDEDDSLNCGIDIIAKPPGKHLQSISLLSGGERTMTAVALLFAIYMVRPSPFCILDEMDAPLDESNINRFIRVLERFVSQSQFIIITHNKRTIAKADILYGVTMEERGVSKLVGMRLTEAKTDDATLPAKAKGPLSQRALDLGEAPEREQQENLALTR